MSPAAEILVIILSIFLAIFLILGIVLLIYFIVLSRRINKVTKSAERTAENIENVVSGFSKLVSPMFIIELVTKFVNGFKKEKKEK